LPEQVWGPLDKPRNLASKPGTGVGAVIGLNAFNLLCAWGFGAYLDGRPEMIKEAIESGQVTVNQLGTLDQLLYAHTSVVFWLATFPLIFSLLIFAGPLVRLPGNIAENKRRRKAALHKALISVLFKMSGPASCNLPRDRAANYLNMELNRYGLQPASMEEFMDAMNDICLELNGSYEPENGGSFVFDRMRDRLVTASNERKSRALGQRGVGQVIYSTNGDEQYDIDQRNVDADMRDFDRQLDAATGKSGYDDFDRALEGSNTGKGAYDGYANRRPADSNQSKYFGY